MVNLRRVPGYLYQKRLQVAVSVLISALFLYVLLQSGLVCTNHRVEAALQQLCSDYDLSLAQGSLCAPLCKEGSVTTISCTPLHSGKHLVFSAHWDGLIVMIKSAYPSSFRRNSNETFPHVSENVFRHMVEDHIATRLNATITTKQMDRVLRLDSRKELAAGSQERYQEQQNVWTLIQSQEYLLSILFGDRDLFPQIIGTCGHLFAVEYLQEPKVNSFFAADDHQVWSERMKLAIMIMDLLEELETNFPDPLHLCDIKMSHFGITSLGRLKYMDLDLVYTDNVIQRMVTKGQICKEDPECDVFDCKATCNADSKKCDVGVINNNLQTVCEKIFIGWTLSGKMLVPGLLMSEHTPASLSSLLRQCAENGRSAVSEDIRQRLYTTLTEMDQILSQRLLS